MNRRTKFFSVTIFFVIPINNNNNSNNSKSVTNIFSPSKEVVNNIIIFAHENLGTPLTSVIYKIIFFKTFLLQVWHIHLVPLIYAKIEQKRIWKFRKMQIDFTHFVLSYKTKVRIFEVEKGYILKLVVSKHLPFCVTAYVYFNLWGWCQNIVYTVVSDLHGSLNNKDRPFYNR